MFDNNFIKIKGARTNNLKNISVNIPKNRLTVITGLSGSGKSSLAFDTIFAEGQRRFIEALSFNNRQLFDQMPKPDVDSIQGLSPAISLSQNNTNRNPKSTVATITDIHNYIRLLFARVGKDQDGRKTNLEPKHFSFNSPHGVCKDCKGKGTILEIEPNLIIDSNLSLNEGAVLPWREEKSKYYIKLLEKVSQDLNIDTNKPVGKLDGDIIEKLLHGIPDKKFKISYKNYQGKTRTRTVPFEGAIKDITKMYKETPSESKKEKLKSYMLEKPCPSCKGFKLNNNSLNVFVASLNIGELTSKSIVELLGFFDKQISEYLNDLEKQVANLIIDEIKKRLYFMKQIGLSYLTLDRSITTLSGGEIQRLRLANQISSDMSGILYVLDEPSIGLHQRDNNRLIKMLKRLVDGGNTVIVVEHDEEIIMSSDYLIDMGPEAGNGGGQILAIGTPEEVSKNKNSLTGQYLSSQMKIDIPRNRRREKGFVTIYNCTENNLKGFDVKFPLGVLTAVTGVSGSGKSTLVNELLFKALSSKDGKDALVESNGYSKVEGVDKVGKVIRVTQSPIGRTPRSTPATYTGVFDDIRDLFERISKVNKKTYRKSDFSFNVAGGRCEECKGEGYIKFDMGFVSDLYITCPECRGSRYTEEILQISYKDKSIADVLEMSIAEALEFFNEKNIVRKLQALVDVGLSYIKLGQPSTTLSGGEAQRIKLASYLYQQGSGNDLFIFDEPTTGLHIHDIKRLIAIFDKIVDMGNTIIVIEHNLDVIKCADYIIDLGPEGGDAGGNIVAEGTPEEVIKAKESLTGQYLKSKLIKN
ncbi:excinuclease ABC subunit UvrA [Rummeliibacillus suwonensis]|uniref:excinuclease ABC subunit UvrA n=1 Tax=Rummeliibacillus suwonensis TaxID=1306154 RepID=UPI0028A03030|nr:excinuclease ABC subunit UvrA [Rummeliibacillus suwonensis]